MSNYILRLTLKRDTTFGRGDGVAGLLDTEVEHDEYGLPFLRGRSLKGMLVHECADILFALNKQGQAEKWHPAARFLFGEPGSQFEEGKAQLYIGNARLPDELRQAIAYKMQSSQQAGQWRGDVLNALTTIRRQTAMEQTGVAKDKSLRTVRLILRKTTFEAPLIFGSPPDDLAKGLLAACLKSFRRGGTARNRGPGLLEADLYQAGETMPVTWFDLFKQEATR